jgi:spermidine/putrescine transport system permease protein
MVDLEGHETQGPGRRRRLTPGPRTPLTAWLLLAPLAAWLLLFVVAPTALLLVISFCQRDFIGRVVYHFTWENYARALDPVYLSILLRSLEYAGLTTVICLVLGYPLAYFIASCRERARNGLLLLVMIPFWTSFLIRTYAWITILGHDGLLNSLLTSTGLLAAPADLLYTPGAVVLGLIHNYLPFMVLPIYASLEKLDRSLVEASYDLGAGPWRTLYSVTLPLTLPGIAGGALLVFVPSIAMFAIVTLMGGGSTELIGNVIQKQFTSGRNQPLGAALGTLLLAVFLAAFAVAGRYSSARKTSSGG